MLKKFAYKRPDTLRAAVSAASQPGASILAGGTDLLGAMRDEVFEVQTVVSLSSLKQLKGIVPAAGGLRIGALNTLTEIAESREIREKYTALAEAAASAASPQLRNQGTLGGNLCQRPRCWYFRGAYQCLRKGGDTCFAAAGQNQYHAIFGGDGCFIVHPSDTAAAAVALGAKLTIVGPKGARAVPAASFFVGPAQSLTTENILAPGEIVTELLLPPPEAGLRSTYRKVRERGAWDFALAGAAVALTLADGKVRSARIVLSGAAPIPWRAAAAEKALTGSALDPARAGQAAAAAVEGAAPLDLNAYKVPLFRGLVEEVLTKLAL
ncbi:MAG TPA: FAD binding domain-containing protein [Bryobacteraceae bacterium]